MIATLSADQRTVTLRGSLWRGSFPVDQLGEQTAFYRRLWERGGKGAGQPGPYAKHYDQSVKALEKVAKIAKAMGVI